MAAPAYSKRLFGGVVPADGSPVDSTPVPAGKLWIVNCITLVPLESPDGYIFIYAPGPLYILSRNMATESGEITLFTHQVLNEGEFIEAKTLASSDDVSLLISGYELYVGP